MAGRLKIYNSSTGQWEYVNANNAKATSADVDAGTDDTLFVTPKALADGFVGGKDGWVKLPACSYNSASSILFAPGVLPVNSPNAGAKIKLTNDSSVKYFIVISVGTDGGGNTILNLSGMNGAVVANSAITLPYYSLMASPRLFPYPSGFMNAAKASGNLYQASDITSSGTNWVDLPFCNMTITLPVGKILIQQGAQHRAESGFTYYGLRSTSVPATASAIAAFDIARGGGGAAGVWTLEGWAILDIVVAGNYTFVATMKGDNGSRTHKAYDYCQFMIIPIS